MYCSPKEHNPPHIHVYYAGKAATFDIKNGKKTDGKISNIQKKLVQAWVVLHKDELLADWLIAMEGKEPYQIDPLK